MVHLPRSTGGGLPDQVHAGHRPLSALERDVPRRMAHHEPLLGPDVPPWCHTYRALGISQVMQVFSHPAANDPGQGQPPV